ncbi:MAG: thioredoxin family protein [Chthoniobacterales bacterium]
MRNNRLFLFPFYRLLVLAVTCCGALSLTSTRADDASWKTSFAQAVAEASQQNKQILLNFTGSDWCPPCRKMDQEVLSQKQFSEFASKNLILVKLDFPRHKKLSADEKAQNDQLAKKYAIQGFPTFVLVDSSGKEVRRQEGYLEGGPVEFLKWAKGQN